MADLDPQKSKTWRATPGGRPGWAGDQIAYMGLICGMLRKRAPPHYFRVQSPDIRCTLGPGEPPRGQNLRAMADGRTGFFASANGAP